MSFLTLTSCFSSGKVQLRELAVVATLKPLDAIIVPGVPFRGGSWNSVMKARVIWSRFLYENGYTQNIIYSGSAVYTPYFEGITMGIYAEKLGIPREHIFCETKARHSTENVYYSYLLAKEKGFKSIGLATDPFQSSLLRNFTRRRFGTKIHHLPFITDTVRGYGEYNPVIDPTPARAIHFTSITKEESIWQRLRGTLGKGIDWSQHPNGRLEAL